MTEEIRLKVRKIWETRESLNKILQSENLTRAIAWKLRKVAQGLRELEEGHAMLLQKYGEIQEDGRTFHIPRTQFPQFKGELDEWLDESFGEPLVLLKYEDLEFVNLSPFDFANLDFLIISPEETNGSEPSGEPREPREPREPGKPGKPGKPGE